MGAGAGDAGQARQPCDPQPPAGELFNSTIHAIIIEVKQTAHTKLLLLLFSLGL